MKHPCPNGSEACAESLSESLLQQLEKMALKFHILPATIDDAEALLACALKANAGDKLMRAFYPPERAHLTPPEQLQEHRMRRMRARFTDENVWQKAVLDDDPNVIVGYSAWTMPKSQRAPKKQDEGEEEDAGDEKCTPPACVDFELQRLFEKECEAHSEKAMPMDSWRKPRSIIRTHPTQLTVFDSLDLQGLSVCPEYQRKGVGSALLRHMLQRVDQDGLPAYMEATADGAKLYPHFGFETRERMDVFPRSHPLHHTMAFMVRPARGTTERSQVSAA